MTVWKYAKRIPELQDVITFDMPRGATILSVVEQYGDLTIYALVDDRPKARQVRRSFRIVGTGRQIPGNATLPFVGTFLSRDHTLVIHVFDLGES